MSTAGSVSHDRKSNASKSRWSTNNVGEGISSKNNKTGGDEEDTTEHSGSLAFGFDARSLLMDPAHDKSTFALAWYNKESFGFLALVVLDGAPPSSCSVVSYSLPPVFYFLEDIPSPTSSVNCLDFDALLFPSQPTDPVVDMVGTESTCFVVRWWGSVTANC